MVPTTCLSKKLNHPLGLTLSTPSLVCHLEAPGGGQAAIVCAVSGIRGGDHGVYEVVQLEAGPGERDLTPRSGDLAHSVSDGLQLRVLRLK